MSKILLENDAYEFIPDDRKSISEARAQGRVFPLPIPGRLSVCDSVNGNNRRYPKRVWEKNINDPASPLQERIKKNAAFGLLEHPKDGHVDLLSPISHLVTKVWMEGSEVKGTITVLNTAEGAKLTALIEAGYNPLVSSRGYGSVVKSADGVDEVQDDFVCESWDVVHTPSFINAQLDVPRQVATTEAVKPEASKTDAPLPTEVWESTTNGEKILVSQRGSATVESTKLQPLGQTATSPGAKSVLAACGDLGSRSAKQEICKNRLDIKSIQESVQSLRAIDPSSLEPGRYAEGINRINQLHREVAALVAEDSKLAWDGKRLHEDLESVEKSWAESMRAPTEQVVKLQEQQTRTLRVVKAVAETGLQLKRNLGEMKLKAAELTKKMEEAIRRGKGWMERAKQAESKAKVLEHKFQVSCASLDLLTERYHADTSTLGKRLLVLEFKLDEKTAKRVSEAKNTKELAAIREELKKSNAPRNAVIQESAPKKDEPTKKDEPVKAPVTEAKKDEPASTIFVAESTLNRPFTIAESVKVGRDLAKTA